MNILPRSKKNLSAVCQCSDLLWIMMTSRWPLHLAGSPVCLAPGVDPGLHPGKKTFLNVRKYVVAWCITIEVSQSTVLKEVLKDYLDTLNILGWRVWSPCQTQSTTTIFLTGQGQTCPWTLMTLHEVHLWGVAVACALGGDASLSRRVPPLSALALHLLVAHQLPQ